eukprot:6368705-Pyramimonas_sp.AAC.2
MRGRWRRGGLPAGAPWSGRPPRRPPRGTIWGCAGPPQGREKESRRASAKKESRRAREAVWRASAKGERRSRGGQRQGIQYMIYPQGEKRSRVEEGKRQGGGRGEGGEGAEVSALAQSLTGALS